MLTTLSNLFSTLFNRDELLVRARALHAVERVKKLHPADVLLAVVRSKFSSEHPSIATARRELQAQTGYAPEESSFYERFTWGLGDLAWETFLRALARANRQQRQLVSRALGLPVRDVRVVDSTVVTMPVRAAYYLPSTDSRLGGFKITTTLSLLEDLLVAAHVTDARQNDRKVLGTLKQVAAVLWIMDRGYFDHHLCADIADGGGYFLIRLKTGSKPVIKTIRRGYTRRLINRHFDAQSPSYANTVDIDARFNVSGVGQKMFRVVGIRVPKERQRKDQWIWLTTNLPPTIPPETVGAFYRLRWAIENLFRTLKSVGRLDELPSANPAVIKVFIAATLLGLVLSQSICAIMRTARPTCEPSLGRVFAMLLSNLASLSVAFQTQRFKPALTCFIAALWREGLNPNPGRRYARERHLCSLGD